MHRKPPPVYFTALVLLTAVGVSLPLVYLVIRAIGADGDKLRELVFRWRNLELLWNTLFLAAAVAVACQLLALPLAWFVARTDLRGRRLVSILAVLPLAIPPYIMAFALLAAGGDYGTAARLFGVTVTPVRMLPYGEFWGATAALSLCHFPYLFLTVRAALLRTDPNLEEASRTLGHNGWGTFWRVVYPQLRPALASGRLLIVLHVLADFGVVSLFGYDTFSRAIYVQQIDRATSAWLGLMLLLVTVVILTIELRPLRGLRLASSARSSRITPQIRKLGRVAWLAYLWTVSILFAALLFPLVTIGFWLSQGSDPAVWEELSSALGQSISASAPAAILTTAVALPLAIVIVRYPSRLSRIAEMAAYVGYATPPLAFALGLIFFALHLNFLYQTMTLLVIGYTLRYLAEALGPIRSSLHKAKSSLEEAARTLGCSPTRAFRRVTLPVVLGGVWVSLAFVFLSVMKELPLTLLVGPLDFQTLATNVWSYIEEAMFAEAAPFALVLVAISAVFVGVLLFTERKSNA